MSDEAAPAQAMPGKMRGGLGDVQEADEESQRLADQVKFERN